VIQLLFALALTRNRSKALKPLEAQQAC